MCSKAVKKTSLQKTINNHFHYTNKWDREKVNTSIDGGRNKVLPAKLNGLAD